MKPLPDLNNVEAMAAIGRESALWSARNHTMKELRDLFTAMQSAQFDAEFVQLCEDACNLCVRLHAIAKMGTNA